MNHAKQRRRQQRAAQFGTPGMGTGEYRADTEARPQDNRSGREWDSQASGKADERELQSAKRDDSGGRDTKGTDQPAQGRTPGREWDAERKPMSSGHKGDVRDTVGGISPDQTDRKGKK